MARKAVVDAVHAYLAANWTACAILEINADLQAPADGAPFIAVEFPVANGEKTTLGHSYRETGGFRVIIATERGAGVSKALDYGEQLRALFLDRTFGGVDTRPFSPTSPRVDDLAYDGNYFRTYIVVPYLYISNN